MHSHNKKINFSSLGTFTFVKKEVSNCTQVNSTTNHTKANRCGGLFCFCTLSNVQSELQSTLYSVSIDYVRQSWGGERPGGGGLLRVNYNNNNITELAVHTGPTLAEACGSSDLRNQFCRS